MTTMPATSAPPAPREPLRMTPGRWVLLAITVPIALAVIGWTGFGFIADIGEASFPIDYTIPVHNGVLTLSSDGADLSVHETSGGSTARLLGKVEYSLVRPNFSENNGPSSSTVDLRCRIPEGNCGLDGNLAVPARTALRLSSGGGDMTISGGTGRATLDTAGGDLTVGDLSGPMVFSTGGGDINGANLTSPTLKVQSDGGDVTLVFTRVPRVLDIESGGGDIDVVLPHGGTYDVVTSSGGGDVSEPASMINPSAGVKITVISDGGDITLSQAQ